MPLPLVAQTAERQTLDEIRDWHAGVVESQVNLRAFIQNALRDGTAVSARFVGMTEADLERYYDLQRRELDRLTILNLVASAEASILDDFFRRIRERLKDPLSRAYRAWHKDLLSRDQLRPPFDGDGVLSVLRAANVLNDNNLVGQYRECLTARHWLGHGRRWDKPPAVDRFDPEDVYDRARVLLAAIPT